MLLWKRLVGTVITLRRLLADLRRLPVLVTRALGRRHIRVITHGFPREKLGSRLRPSHISTTLTSTGMRMTNRLRDADRAEVAAAHDSSGDDHLTLLQ